MDKLAGMAMFVRVVKCGSFAAAAEVSEVFYAQDRRPTAKLRSAIDFLLAGFGPGR